jgi:hypothetical protein
MLETIEHRSWTQAAAAPVAKRATAMLEEGALLLLPQLSFGLEAEEQIFLDPAISDGHAKNVSYDPKSGRSGGTGLQGPARKALDAMIARFADQAQSLVTGLLPRYAARLERARTSFRPCEVEDRPQNERKDDRRLHIDAFPSQPVQGRRILRVFCNVNPAGEPRVWNVGEPFEDFARAFAPRVKRELPGAAWFMERLGITKGRRTGYDAAMLRLHDLAKLDDDYQADAPRTRLDLPAGGTWLVFTDRVLHAALAGQHIFEQTFLLPVEAMEDERRSPLRILERLLGRSLV